VLAVGFADGAHAVNWSDRGYPGETHLRHETAPFRLPIESLDGTGNNRLHPQWGKSGTNYIRVADVRYADGRSAMVAGPTVRYISNRVFNDVNQNVFSERDVSRWAFVWGQFLDHTIGLRDDAGEQAPIPFNNKDPLESFTNTLGSIPFARSKAAPGTGATNPRQQINTVSSYIDAWAVYGGTAQRLEWLRAGPVDGNMTNNSASLLLPGGELPRADARGDAATAPTMALDGRLAGQPAFARVAGDVRANENLGLLAIQTLLAREHNRIISQLPNSLTEEQKFQIARRVVIAEQQFITYNEFLPALGVRLAPYRGYKPDVNASLSNEFATVGYRAHSMIHGDFGIKTDAARYTEAQLDSFEKLGIEVTRDGDRVAMEVPLNLAFFNPDLLDQLQLGPVLQGLGEPEYRNDELIDNQLRSVLFQIPVAGNTSCLDGPDLPKCFNGVLDLGAIDVQRGRDHGMPSYNQLRRAYGLAPKTSFQAITGEATDRFPRSPVLTPGDEINDPNSLDFVKLFDIGGRPVTPGTDAAEESVVTAVRRTPLAARLKAIYGSVNKVDAFVGMVSEPHLPGSDLGELQLAMWRKQFTALRDGDRFFYQNDPGLSYIKAHYGIDFRRSLATIVADDTDLAPSDLNPDIFFVARQEAGRPTEHPASSPLPTPAARPRSAPQAARSCGQSDFLQPDRYYWWQWHCDTEL
jgi:hypothetical protein